MKFNLEIQNFGIVSFLTLSISIFLRTDFKFIGPFESSTNIFFLIFSSCSFYMKSWFQIPDILYEAHQACRQQQYWESSNRGSGLKLLWTSLYMGVIEVPSPGVKTSVSQSHPNVLLSRGIIFNCSILKREEQNLRYIFYSLLYSFICYKA